MLPQSEETVLQASLLWKANSIPALSRCAANHKYESSGDWDEIGVNVLSQHSFLCLACADVEDRHNQERCLDLNHLNAALLSCSLRKRPSGLAANIGVSFTPRFSMWIRKVAPNPQQTSPEDSRRLRYTPYISDWDHCQTHWQDSSPEVQILAKHTHSTTPKAIWIPDRNLSWRPNDSASA